MTYKVTSADIAEALTHNPCVEARFWLAARPDGFSLAELDADWYWWLGKRQPRLFSLDSEALDKCAKARPRAALQYAAPCLAPAMRARCAKAQPRAALQYAALYLTSETLARCAKAAPLAALQFAATNLDPATLDRCAKAHPWAALQFAATYLDPATLACCAKAHPWVVLEYAERAEHVDKEGIGI